MKYNLQRIYYYKSKYAVVAYILNTGRPWTYLVAFHNATSSAALYLMEQTL